MANVTVDQAILDENDDYGEAACAEVTVYCGFTASQLRALCKRANIEVTNLDGIHAAAVSLLKETLNEELPELADFYVTVR